MPPNPIKDWTTLSSNAPTYNYNNRPSRYNIRTTPGADVAGNYINVDYLPKSSGNSFGNRSLGSDYRTADYWGLNKQNDNIATPQTSYYAETNRDINGLPTISGINNTNVSIYPQSNGSSYTPSDNSYTGKDLGTDYRDEDYWNPRFKIPETSGESIIRDSGKSYSSIPVSTAGVVKQNGTANNTAVGNNNTATNRNYNRNVFFNGAKSMLRHLPTTDSVQQYIEAKRDTPDYSAINAAKHYAMRPTHVLRQSPSHISSNIKFNPYDYTNEANQINALAANGINNIRKRGSGNLNALIGNVANLLAQARQSAGDAARKGWKANEDGRIAVGQANNKADEFNAVADNQADANYVQSRNSAALQDKSNGINALNTYAQRKYDMDLAHKNLLRGLRDQMVGNLGEEGMTAYENNRANTNRMRNYWTDGLGRHHYLSSQISDDEKMELAKDFLGSKEFTNWFNANYKQQNG